MGSNGKIIMWCIRSVHCVAPKDEYENNDETEFEWTFECVRVADKNKEAHEVVPLVCSSVLSDSFQSNVARGNELLEGLRLSDLPKLNPEKGKLKVSRL